MEFGINAAAYLYEAREEEGVVLVVLVVVVAVVLAVGNGASGFPGQETDAWV